MDRRMFLGTLAGSLLAPPLPADAQQAGKMWRIGILFADSRRTGLDLLQERLRNLGYVEGRDIGLEVRSADDKPERLPGLAAELVVSKVDIIVATVTPAAQAAKRATTVIPIVFAVVSDPVASGLVVDLAHPGGNATGLTTSAPDIAGKRLQLLKELIPSISRIAVLWNAANPIIGRQVRETELAAHALGVKLNVVGVRAAADFEHAFRDMHLARTDAVVILSDFLTFSHRGHIGELAAKYRLVTISEFDDFATAGGLMAYGPSIRELAGRTAHYVDKIIKGAKPADLPVEQPTKFELVINLKTAKALGLTIPQSLLLRADHVIE